MQLFNYEGLSSYCYELILKENIAVSIPEVLIALALDISCDGICIWLPGYVHNESN